MSVKDNYSDVGTSKLDQAKDAINATAETVKATTKSVSDAVDAAREPGGPLDLLKTWARQAPLQALGVAFLIGFMISRR